MKALIVFIADKKYFGTKNCLIECFKEPETAMNDIFFMHRRPNTLNGPDRVEVSKWPNPVRKVRLQIKEDLGQKVTSLKVSASKDSLLWNLCYNVICIHNINSSVKCTVWLYICFTCEGCNVRSIIKRSTRVMTNIRT